MTFKQLCDWAPLSSFFTKDTLSGQQYYYYYYYYYYSVFYTFIQCMDVLVMGVYTGCAILSYCNSHNTFTSIEQYVAERIQFA